MNAAGKYFKFWIYIRSIEAQYTWSKNWQVKREMGNSVFRVGDFSTLFSIGDQIDRKTGYRRFE